MNAPDDFRLGVDSTKAREDAGAVKRAIAEIRREATSRVHSAPDKGGLAR